MNRVDPLGLTPMCVKQGTCVGESIVHDYGGAGAGIYGSLTFAGASGMLSPTITPTTTFTFTTSLLIYDSIVASDFYNNNAMFGEQVSTLTGVSVTSDTTLSYSDPLSSYPLSSSAGLGGWTPGSVQTTGTAPASNRKPAPNNGTPQQPQQTPQQPQKQPWYCGTGNSWSHPFTAPTGRQWGQWSVVDLGISWAISQKTGGKDPVSKVFGIAGIVEGWGWASCN